MNISEIILTCHSGRRLEKAIFLPFAVQKGLEDLSGESNNEKKLQNGSLWIQYATEGHSKCLLKCNLVKK